MSDDGFEAFYRENHRRVVLALRVTAADAEDLAQEAFARTLVRWAKVRHGANPLGYVFRVAFRLQRRRRLLPLPLAARADRSTSPELWGEVAALREAVARLPPGCRRVAVLCLFIEMTPSEAAAALGVRPSTVRTQLQRAREALAESVSADPPDDGRVEHVSALVVGDWTTNAASCATDGAGGQVGLA